jgi:ketosteroid isomerase-like protein
MSQHVDMLRTAYAAWAQSRGAGVDQWMSMLTDDAEVGSIADGAPGWEFTKGGTGKAAARAYLEGLTSQWEMIEFAIDEYVEQGDRVVALGRAAWRSRSNGHELRTRLAGVWGFRGDQADRYFEFYDSAGLVGMGAEPQALSPIG